MNLFNFSDLLHLLWPEVCAACSNGLYRGEKVICTRCLYHLPRTGFHAEPGNPVEKAFWGKTPVFSATALYHFNKGERVQQLIHSLKYRGEQEAGHFAGFLLGKELLTTSRFSVIDRIVPVPLHITKLRSRGFNQSDCIARGVAEAMSVPVTTDFLVRNRITATQTKKSRYERFENVDRIFHINPKYEARPQHFLLIDDVITTGSTLTACAEVLNDIPGARVSIAALAYAR